MADVILIYPRTLWDIKNVTTRLPLAALYIGTVLQERGFSVRVIDQRVDDRWPDTLRNVLHQRPLWVGVSSMTGRQIRWGLDASRIVRDADPTILPEQTLDHPLVDVVAVGEGETTALELSQALRDLGPHADLNDVAGLVWQGGGQAVHNQPRPYTPMDEWPLLDYGLVDVESYILSEVPGERSLQITTSRGCPWHCAYCYLTVVPDGRRYRAEAPERTVERIERTISLFDLNAIHIIDDEFFTQRKRARRVCELIVERGIEVTLRTNCRIDYADKMSIDDLRLFRRAGFKHVYLGAESGNDRVLGFIKKDITREQILRVNRKFEQADISPKYSFMGGFPRDHRRGQGHHGPHGPPRPRQSPRVHHPRAVVQSLSGHRAVRLLPECRLAHAADVGSVDGIGLGAHRLQLAQRRRGALSAKDGLFHLFPGREDGRRVDALSLDAPGGQSLRMDRPAAGQAACLCLHAQSQADPLSTGAQQLRK